jgi:hypothetical protein
MALSCFLRGALMKLNGKVYEQLTEILCHSIGLKFCLNLQY